MSAVDFSSYVQSMDLYSLGVQRVEELLRGDLPLVESLAIFPNLSDGDLIGVERDLTNEHYFVAQVKGENALVVPNITRERATEYPMVVWAQRHIRHGKPYFRFEWIENGTTKKSRILSRYGEGRSQFELPYLDNPDQKIDMVLTRSSNDLSLDDEVQEAAILIRECQEELREPGKPDKWYWSRRALIRSLVSSLDQ